MLLDAMPPRRNGFDVLREPAPAAWALPSSPAARGQVSDKVRGLKLGADDYVTKPFDNAELLARIEACLRPAQPGTSAPPRAPVTVRDLIIDVRAAEVRGGRPVGPLAARVPPAPLFRGPPRRHLSRSELLQHVWGYDADVPRGRWTRTWPGCGGSWRTIRGIPSSSPPCTAWAIA